ncbi:MAG: TetR/AcrR family transcriptional regulator [Chloroflexi bacterium]|nr:TetR/AcrR family transcriptional regulator [Chloroflexota bacterium]
MKTTTRLTADERRTDVIAAASKEFAARGYAGTSTQAIAGRAGVSQPYLFQLFGTKKDLFIEAVHACFERTRSTFEASARTVPAESADPTSVLEAMGCGYHDLLRDRDMLRLQLHAYAACDDPEIRAVVRGEWSVLHETVTRLSGADPAAIHAWFAEGMLLNVAAALGNLDDAVDLKLDLGGAFAWH